jgi:hypothetical protein
MTRRRIAAIACLIILGLPLGGCTHCGWIWDDWGHKPKSCSSDEPR